MNEFTPEALSANARQSTYETCVNPQWVRLLDVLGMNVHYATCLGSELFTANDKRILDFNSGYCVHNVGHNHPGAIRALKNELDRNGPAMLQGHVPLAGELANRLCMRAAGRLSEVFFCSSASEGVDAVIKFARAHTLMDDPFWTRSSGRCCLKRTR